MDMSILRDWLIQRGIPAEELDEISEPPVLRDVGGALVLLLQSVDSLGEALVMLMEQNEQLSSRLEALENA